MQFMRCVLVVFLQDCFSNSYLLTAGSGLTASGGRDGAVDGDVHYFTTLALHIHVHTHARTHTHTTAVLYRPSQFNGGKSEFESGSVV